MVSSNIGEKLPSVRKKPLTRRRKRKKTQAIAKYSAFHANAKTDVSVKLFTTHSD